MPKTHVIMCQRRFVPLIEAGTKLSTIRGERKRKITSGDTLDLRYWSGLPYRSKQVKIRLVPHVRVRPITINTARGGLEVVVNCRLIISTELDLLVLRDGFGHFTHFAQFFYETHGPLFDGVLIEWSA